MRERRGASRRNLFSPPLSFALPKGSLILCSRTDIERPSAERDPRPGASLEARFTHHIKKIVAIGEGLDRLIEVTVSVPSREKTGEEGDNLPKVEEEDSS